MDAKNIFQAIHNGMDKGVVLVGEVLDKVFYAVEALVVDRMQAALMRDGTPLIDLASQIARNKNLEMDYAEVEKLMTKLQIYFNRDIFQNIVITRLLDPSQKKGRVSFEQLKRFFGEGSIAQPPSGSDSIPHKENGFTGSGVSSSGIMTSKRDSSGIKPKSHQQIIEEHQSSVLK